MKHIRGNTPKCWSCKYYTEAIEEKLRFNNTGWCINPKELAIGVNGRRRKDPPDREQTEGGQHACKFWIDAESGYTRFEVETGYKEPYDGTKINFDEEQMKMEV